MRFWKKKKPASFDLDIVLYDGTVLVVDKAVSYTAKRGEHGALESLSVEQLPDARSRVTFVMLEQVVALNEVRL